MLSASRGLNPKKAASNRSMSSITLPAGIKSGLSNADRGTPDASSSL